MSKATDIADTVVKTLIYDVVMQAVAAGLIYEAPWLKLPFINYLFNFVMQGLADRLYQQLDRIVEFQVIAIEATHQNNEYVAAASALKDELTKPKEIQNAEALEKAKAEFKRRLADLIRFRP